MFIRNADRVKAHCILYPVMHRVRTMHDVVFDEGWG